MEHCRRDPSLESSLQIEPGSIAAQDGRLEVGDIIVQVDHIGFTRILQADAVKSLMVSSNVFRVYAQLYFFMSRARPKGKRMSPSLSVGRIPHGCERSQKQGSGVNSIIYIRLFRSSNALQFPALWLSRSRSILRCKQDLNSSRSHRSQ